MIKKNKLNPFLYVGLFLFVILIILVENSYLLINQTRTNITETSWLDTNNLINSIIASARQSIEYVQLSDQQIQRHIRKISGQIDRLYSDSGARAEEELSELVQNFKIISFSILDNEGRQIYSFNRHLLPQDLVEEKAGAEIQPAEEPSESPPGPTSGVTATKPAYSRSMPDLQLLTTPRQRGEGSIQLYFGEEKLQEIRARIGLQLLINSLEAQNVIQSISFMNDQLVIIADYEPSRINSLDERLEYLDALNKGERFIGYNRARETIRWVHPILYTQEMRGVFGITFQRTGVQQIYANTKQITIINSIIIMVLAIVSAVLMLVFHRRNMAKMEAMEKTIRENEKLVSLANLTAGVAHEVRNPLNSISITIQRLQMEFIPPEKADRDDYMTLTATMKKEVDRINKIITDFLDFAKPFSPDNTCFNLDDFIQENISFLSAEADKANIRVKTHIATGQAEFYGDYQKLTQVLINLFINALEATPSGGTISIYSEITKDNCWELKIEDSGEGISAKDINHIFDIYFTTKKSGSGLGLYISRKIVQAHEGNIEIKPNPIGGTTAVVTLPFRPC